MDENLWDLLVHPRRIELTPKISGEEFSLEAHKKELL
jgi:hypothetical protein